MNALEDASQRALEAVENGDLETLAAIVKEREQLLGTIGEDSIHAFKLGEAARDALSTLKQQIVAEHARLEQLRKGFAEVEQVSRIQLEG
jgi:hypothetical protein